MSCDNTRCYSFDLTVLIGFNGALAVDRLSERVNYSSQHYITYRNLNNSTGGLNGITLGNIILGSEKNRTDVVFFQVHDHSVNIAGELKQLTLHCLLKTMYSGDAVCNLNYSSDFGDFQFVGISLDLILDHRTDFFWF